MARRRQIFGPLTYTTLAFGLVAIAYSVYVIHWPEFEKQMIFRRAVAALGSANAAERGYALKVVAGDGADAARPHFLAMIGDPRPEVRVEGLAALAGTQHDLASLAPALVALAGDRDPSVRQVAAARLGAVTSSPSRTIEDAAKVAAEGPTGSALRALRSLLADPSPAVRAAAAGALASSPSAGASPAALDSALAAALDSALGDTDRGVRLVAARALLALRGRYDAKATEVLLALALALDPEPRLDRGECVRALARSAAPVIEAVVSGLADLARSEDDAIRVDALQCLAALGPRARPAIPALEAIVAGEPTGARALAVDVILAIVPEGSPKASALRLGIIGDPTMPLEQRAAAIDALRTAIPPKLPEAATVLIGRLSDPGQLRRAQALELLASVLRDIPARPLPAASPPKP